MTHILNLVIDAGVKGYHYAAHAMFQGSKHKCTVWMGKPLLYQALATSLHNIVHMYVAPPMKMVCGQWHVWYGSRLSIIIICSL